jgi:vacuolar-type H+-ATPase subunit H
MAEEERIKNAKVLHKKELKEANAKSKSLHQELERRGSKIKEVMVNAFRKRCLNVGQRSD